MNTSQPQQIPFPSFRFSTPARYHNPHQQSFQIGDVVWYQIEIVSPQHSSSPFQWGEGVIMEIHHKDENIQSTNTTNNTGNNKLTYTIAGKAWDYDHWTHPWIGRKNTNPNHFAGGGGNLGGIGGRLAAAGTRNSIGLNSQARQHNISSSLGTQSAGPPLYMNIKDAEEGRALNRQWTMMHHPNMFIRQQALVGNADQVMHPALANVPHDAIFKVWDRKMIPEKPIPSVILPENQDSSRNDEEDNTANNIHDTETFQGATQLGYGPEIWGITLEQLKQVQDIPTYHKDMSMYDVVQTVIKPITAGNNMGYSLLVNKDKPLRALQMVSHAWGESYSDFVEALKSSNHQGPFWVCAMSIYQNEDNPNLTISKQLGPNIEQGPFATVLRQATTMIAVFTPAMDIYLRMWCVFEIFIATKYNVNVTFASVSRQYRSGIENIYDSIFEYGRNRCESSKARCGNPKLEMNDDEKKIRSLIDSYPGKFGMIDSVVEWCKVMYHIQNLETPGTVFEDKELHPLLLGGPRRYDFLAKTLSSISLSSDRIQNNNNSTGSDRVEKQNNENPTRRINNKVKCCGSDGCIIA